MIVKKIFLFGTFMSLVACEIDNQSISVIVEIENGSIKGVQEGNLKKYLGIPYAEPPIDELRWAPTKPAQNWKGIKSVESNSKICFQPKQFQIGTFSIERCSYQNLRKRREALI